MASSVWQRSIINIGISIENHHGDDSGSVAAATSSGGSVSVASAAYGEISALMALRNNKLAAAAA